MKILDLFCCAGGSSLGMSKFGEITGVDIDPQEEYRWNFIQKDVFKLDIEWIRTFDFIWSSPPCQAYSCATGPARSKGKEYPDLIDETRELLIKIGKPFVIENVPGSPLRRNLLLCGSMFGLGVRRHRWFEINGFKVEQPLHPEHENEIITVVGDGYDLSEAQTAMEIFHITDKHHLSQAVPPAYSNYILEQFLDHGRDHNQISAYEDTKLHRIHFNRNGNEIFETSKVKGLTIMEFLSNNMPGVL